VVGSKIDAEGALRGTMIVKLLSAGGIPVTDKVGFGTTPVARMATMAGEIDLYPEYTGNGGFFLELGRSRRPQCGPCPCPSSGSD